MITATVSEKIEKMAKATKTPAKGNKPKAKVAKDAKPVVETQLEQIDAKAATVKRLATDLIAKAKKEGAVFVQRVAAEPVAAEPVAAEPVAPAEPVAAEPAIPPSLKDQVFADFGLRQGTHRAVMVSHLIDHLNEQVPFATLAAIAWAGVQQKTNTTTSVSTSVKKLERRIIRNKLEDRYTIRREVIDGALTAGLYKL